MARGHIFHARGERQLLLEVEEPFEKAGWGMAGLAATGRAPSITPPVSTVVLPPS